VLLLIISGAVLACGALFVLSAAAKVYRIVLRTDGGGAIQRALRIGPRRWRWIELAAALTEACTGTAVCADFHPAAAGAAMAAHGALFSAALAYARRVKATGGCACVRRPKDPGAGIGWPVQIRAGWLLAVGVLEATIRLPGLAHPAASWIVVVMTAAAALVVMVGVEGPWRTPRCGRRIWRPKRDAVRALMRHGVFEAMVTSAGPFSDGFSYSREGCTDEFRFTAASRAGRADRAVAFRVSRTAPGGALAVEARIEIARG
jgi:hypothetical protein